MGSISGAVLGIATVNILQVRLALVLVDPEYTYPHLAQKILNFVQVSISATPIILLSPRILGFSKAYATFDIDLFLKKINVDEIAWVDLPTQDNAQAIALPF